MDRRRFLYVAGMTGAIAGCSEAGDDAESTPHSDTDNLTETEAETETTTETEINSRTYGESVLNTLATEDAFEGDVSTVETTNDRVSSPGVVASKSRTFESQGSELTIIIVVFESAEDAATYINTRETQLEGQGAQISSAEIGDEAHSIVSGQTVGYDARAKNAVVTIFGVGSLNGFRTIVEGQIGAIRRTQQD